MTVPIIGQTRSWKQVRFGFQAIEAPVIEFLVEPKKEVVGWQVALQGLRSDDQPIRVQATIDVREITKDPMGTAFQVVLSLVGELDTYRECPCSREGGPCSRHATKQPRAS